MKFIIHLKIFFKLAILNITDLSERDFPVNAASIANEMATTKVISNSDNLNSKGMFYDVQDLDERIKLEDTEKSDPNFPNEEYENQILEEIEIQKLHQMWEFEYWDWYYNDPDYLSKY